MGDVFFSSVDQLQLLLNWTNLKYGFEISLEVAFITFSTSLRTNSARTELDEEG